MLEPGMTRAVLLAHGHKCRYCGGVADSADHIIPRHVGGSDDASNLTAACRPCNGRKGGLYLADKALEKELLIEAFILAPVVEQGVRTYRASQAIATRRASVQPEVLGLVQWARQGRSKPEAPQH